MLKKKRKVPSGFLPVLPTSNIAGWWEKQPTDSSGTLTGGEHGTLTGGGHKGCMVAQATRTRSMALALEQVVVRSVGKQTEGARPASKVVTCQLSDT